MHGTSFLLSSYKVLLDLFMIRGHIKQTLRVPCLLFYLAYRLPMWRVGKYLKEKLVHVILKFWEIPTLRITYFLKLEQIMEDTQKHKCYVNIRQNRAEHLGATLVWGPQRPFEVSASCGLQAWVEMFAIAKLTHTEPPRFIVNVRAAIMYQNHSISSHGILEFRTSIIFVVQLSCISGCFCDCKSAMAL